MLLTLSSSAIEIRSGMNVTIKLDSLGLVLPHSQALFSLHFIKKRTWECQSEGLAQYPHEMRILLFLNPSQTSSLVPRLFPMRGRQNEPGDEAKSTPCFSSLPNSQLMYYYPVLRLLLISCTEKAVACINCRAVC